MRHSGCCSALLPADLRDRQASTNLPRQQIGDLCVPGNRFRPPCLWIAPQGVRTTFALEITPMQTQGDARGIRASLDGDRFAKGIGRRSAQSILAAVFQNQLDGRTQVFTAFFHTAPLPVGAGDFRGPGDKPLAVALNDRGELVSHGSSIDRKLLAPAGKRFDFRAIAFQISLRATFVILNVVKDLRSFLPALR